MNALNQRKSHYSVTLSIFAYFSKISVVLNVQKLSLADVSISTYNQTLIAKSKRLGVALTPEISRK